MADIHLETKNLSFTYHDGTKALKNVNIQIKKGEKIAIMGPNGAGKSTLFSHFNGLTEPTSGHVEVEGEKSFLSGGTAQSKAESGNSIPGSK